MVIEEYKGLYPPLRERSELLNDYSPRNCACAPCTAFFRRDELCESCQLRTISDVIVKWSKTKESQSDMVFKFNV